MSNTMGRGALAAWTALCTAGWWMLIETAGVKTAAVAALAATVAVTAATVHVRIES